MGRRPNAWLLALPLMGAGSLGAHALAYRIVEPGEEARAHLLASTGHGYLEAAPFALGACLALVAAALVAAVARGLRGAVSSPPGYTLALLPPVAFALQEHLERVLSGTGSAGTALEPTFLVGLLLQLPFAALAILLARRLARAAEALGSALAPSPFRTFPLSPQAPSAEPLLPRPSLVALGCPGRAPPG